MSFTLYLESSTAPNSQPSHNFEIEFPRAIPLYGRQYEVALQRASLWNSIYNVDASAYQNATFSYTHTNITGGVPVPVTIPDGIYTVSQLSAFIHQTLEDNGHAPLDGFGNPQYGITLYPNFSTFKVEIQLPVIAAAPFSSIPFSFTFTSKFQELLGFKPPTYNNGDTIAVSTYGNTTADITNGVNQWFIECDLIAGSGNFKNNQLSNILYSFTIKTPPSSTFDLEPVNRYFVPLARSDYIDKVRMTIRDQLGRIQDFQGEPISYTLHFRPSQNYNTDDNNL